MTRAGQVTLALLVVAVCLAPAVAVAAVSGSPDLSVYATDNRVTAGETTAFGITVLNTGNVSEGGQSPSDEQRVTTARGVTVEVDAGNAPVEVETDTIALGTVPEGAVPVGTPIQVDVADDAAPGIYQLPVMVEYEYTSEIDGTEHTINNSTESFSVRLVVEGSPRFEVVDTTTAVPIDGTGDVNVTLRNTGSGLARDAIVSLQSGSADLTFENAASASTFVGDWAPGETRTVSVDANVASGASVRLLPLRAIVSYEDDEGIPAERTVTTGIEPGPEQSFSLEDTNVTLRVGEDGVVSGVVRNDGPVTVENAVVVFQPTGSVTTPETEYALGDLAAGETASFRFDVTVSAEGQEGPRQFTYRIEYEENGDRILSDPLYDRATVAPSRDIFEVTPTDASVEAGRSTALTVEVTNVGDEPISEVSAKLFANAPVGVSDDEAFVDSIDPGESREVVFRVSAAAGATPKAYPVSIDFRYTEPDGDTKLSDSYTVPVEVTESSDGGFLGLGAGVEAGVGVAGAVGLALVAIGYVRARP